MTATLRRTKTTAAQSDARSDLYDSAARSLAALVELTSRIQCAPSPSEACHELADGLRRYLGCGQVVIGLCRSGAVACRVEAVSKSDSFPGGGADARTLETALQEIVVRDDWSQWPPPDENSRFGLRALRQHAAACGALAIVGGPLRDESGVVRGAWLFVGPTDVVCCDETRMLLQAAASPVASALQLLARAQPTWPSQLLQHAADLIARRRGWAIVAALSIAAAILLLAVPRRVKCNCRLEPVTRRFVAAPFDGPLHTTFVRPGDFVTQDQLLATMDGREIRWELAGVQAELYRAATQRAGHVASHNAGDAELARYEVDRLQFREQLLKARDQELAIRSPVDGLVVSGDRKDAEGMPLKVGEVLFEVAPLDTMDVELSIPEDDLPDIRAGMPVRIVLDAFPLRSYESTIDRICPRAEIRDDENVFVAQVRLENPTQSLRPGMCGYARISAGKTRLGWLLLRRPLAALLQALGW